MLAALRISAIWLATPGLARFQSTPTRESLGAASVSNWSLLPESPSSVPWDSPVTFPPGRARLATSPVATGSPAIAITIGIVVVASFAAKTPTLWVTITSTFRRTSSFASSGRRSCFPSLHRYSSATFLPST